MSKRWMVLCAVASVAALRSSPARAEEDQEEANSEGAEAGADRPKAPSRFTYDVGLRAAINPGAVLVTAGVTYRRPFYASSDPALARNGFDLRLGVGASLPGVRPSATLGVDPVSFLRLTAGYVGSVPYGKIGGAFTSPNDDFGRTLVSGIPVGPNGTYFRWTNTVLLGAELRAVVERVLVRTAWKAIRTDTSLEDGDRVLYDPYVDNLVSPHGWAYRGDTDVGLMLADGAPGRVPILGVRLTSVFVWYDPSNYAPGEPSNTTNSPTAKVGPWLHLPLATPRDHWFFPGANLTVIAQWYVLDRFHTGQTTPSAVPNVGVALTAHGDVWPR